MDDDCSSSKASSPLLNNHQVSVDLPAFVDRFGDIPEPMRTHMIEASLSALRQHMERMMDHIQTQEEPCWDCTEQLQGAVMAAESIRMEGVQAYWSALARCLFEFECRWEEERVEKENKYGRWIWLHDTINSSQYYVDDEDDDEALEIYDCERERL